jgi:hypothetical protein
MRPKASRPVRTGFKICESTNMSSFPVKTILKNYFITARTRWENFKLVSVMEKIALRWI